MRQVAKDIEWGGQQEFRQAAEVPNEKLPKLKLGRTIGSPNTYGRFVRHDKLTFARINGAGHMVNEKRPKEAKKMFYQWIFKGELTSSPDDDWKKPKRSL